MRKDSKDPTSRGSEDCLKLGRGWLFWGSGKKKEQGEEKRKLIKVLFVARSGSELRKRGSTFSKKRGILSNSEFDSKTAGENKEGERGGKETHCLENRHGAKKGTINLVQDLRGRLVFTRLNRKPLVGVSGEEILARSISSNKKTQSTKNQKQKKPKKKEKKKKKKKRFTSREGTYRKNPREGGADFS